MAKTLTSLSKAIQSETAIESIAIASSGGTEKVATIVHATATVVDSSAGGNLSAAVHVHVPKRTYPLLEDIKAKRKAEWNIPRQDNEFIGRQTLLKALHEQLLQANSNDGKDIKEAEETIKVLVNALKGLGGIGKSELALNYIRNTPHPHSLRAWFPADNPLVLKQKYFELARELRFVGDKEAEAITYLKLWFKEYSGWLLVFDNVNHYDEIKALLPEGKGKIILTTRFQRWPNTFKSIEVPQMEEREAIALILSLIPSPHQEKCRKEEKELASLVKTLGNLPLALVQAGAYIAANEISIGKYRELYQQNEALLLQTAALEVSAQMVATTWNISLQALAKEPTTALSVDLITGCAYLASDAIPKTFLLEWMKETYKLDEVRFNHCIEGLKRYSLVKTDESSVSIHRVVQRVVRLQQSGKLVQKDNVIKFPVLNLEWYSKLLIAAHSEFNRETKVLEDELRRQTLFSQLQSLKEHYEALGFIDNVAFSNVLFDIGHTLLYQKGDAKTAKIYYERALAIDEQHYGSQHVAVASTLMNLGNAYGDLGDAKTAKIYYERALVIQQQHYGSQHVAVAPTLANLGNAYGELGDTKKKKELLERALAIQQQHYGPQHVAVARTLTNLGCAYGALRDAKQKKELLERALAIQQQHYGPQHVEVAATLASLGNAYGALGDTKKKKELLERALAIQQQHYGPQHVAVAATLASLGNAYGALGDTKKKKELLERALAILEQHYGPQHIDVAITLFNLAVAEHALGNTQEALHLVDKGYAIFLRDYGEHHAYTKKAHNLKLTCQKALSEAAKVAAPMIFSSGRPDELKLKQILEKYKTAEDKEFPSAEVAFQRAAACGCKEEVEFLLSAVKDVNAQDDNPKSKRTALHWAAIKKHQDIFDFLVSKGAKVDIKDAEGKTANDYGKMNILNSSK